MLQTLLAHFGHLAVLVLLVLGGIGVPVPEELVQLTGGYMARRGLLVFWPTVAAAWIGIVVGDSLFFYLARRHGPGLLESRHVARVLTPRRRAFLERHFARHAVLTVMVARHASFLRLPAFALAALHGVRPLTFAIADGVSAMVSVPLVVWAGWALAGSIEVAKRELREAELLLVAVLALLFLTRFGLRALRVRRASRPQAEREE